MIRSVVLIALAFVGAGCSVRLGPAPATIQATPGMPLLRIGEVKETFTGTWAPEARARGAGVRAEVIRLLRESKAASLFATDPANLTLDLSIVGNHEDDTPRLFGLGCLSIATLGLLPLNYRSVWDHQCEVSIRMANGTVAATYPIQVTGTYTISAYPLTMFSLFAASFRGDDDAREIGRRVASNIVADIVKQVASEYPHLAQFHEANARLAGAAAVLPLPAISQPPPQTPTPATYDLARIAQRWAVIIGVSEYKHAGVGGLTNLRYAARDAQRLYDQLVSSSPATWPKENIRLLTNKDATEHAVREALLTFLQKAQKDDLVLIFFSGHGTPDPARPKNNYFLCHDTDPSNLPATGFPMWEIDNALERGIIEARRVAVLADACHSGGFAPEGMRDIRVVSRNVSEGFQTLGKKASCRVVTSCEPGELSQEKAEWGEGHGAFAYALIKGLAGAADSAAERNARGNGDGKVDLDELVYYLRREVGDLTSNGQHVQDAGRLNAVLLQR